MADPESSRKMAACMLKTFNRMKKRIGFLLYQFVLPALQVRPTDLLTLTCTNCSLQVSLFCLAIGQDPKELPVAVVNAENGGLACASEVDLQCPISLEGTFGIPEPNEHLANFTCRYLRFVERGYYYR